jgi:hypothetical protein
MPRPFTRTRLTFGVTRRECMHNTPTLNQTSLPRATTDIPNPSETSSSSGLSGIRRQNTAAARRAPESRVTPQTQKEYEEDQTKFNLQKHH